MLLRQDARAPRAAVAITQPCHGWVAGQLARAWGSQAAGAFAPREEVCLAAEQHDLAWAAWEQAPTLNAGTGLPHAFPTVPLAERLAFWPRAAERLVLPQSRYAALLVSLHATRLHAGFDPTREAPPVAAALRGLLEGEEQFRAGLLADLRADPRYAQAATDEAVDRNYRLLATWDRLSLILCAGVREPRVLPAVPAGSGAVDLTVCPAGAHADSDTDTAPGGDHMAHAAPEAQRVRVEPWPFAADSVTIVWEGRRLRGPYADEESMRAALRGAAWVTGEAVLVPGAG